MVVIVIIFIVVIVVIIIIIIIIIIAVAGGAAVVAAGCWLLAAGCWLLAAVAGLLTQYSVLQTVALRHPGDAGGKRAVTRSVSRWFGITAVSSARGRRSRLLDGRRSRLLDGQWKRRAALTSVSSRRPPVEGLDGRWKGGGRGVFPRPHPVGVAVLAPPLAAGATPVCLDARGGGLPELWLATVGAPPGGVRPTALMADHGLPVCDGRLGDGLPVCDGRLLAVVGDGRRRAREQRGEGAHGPRYGRKVVNGVETTAGGRKLKGAAEVVLGLVLPSLLS